MHRAAALLLVLAVPAVGGAEGAAGLPDAGTLAPLVRVGEVERFTPDSLWEKINGEAELYRRFGLREAAFAYFEHPQEPSRGLEVSAFLLAEPLGAFGLWAAVRPAAAAVEPLGNGAFRTRYHAALWHGATFVRLHAFGDDGQRAEHLAAGLREVAAGLGAVPPRPALLHAFEALVAPGTVRFAPDHLLGREALPPGLEGRTEEGLGVFVSSAGVGEPEGYRARLREGRAVALADGEGFGGIDPDLGPVSWVVRSRRLAGLRAPPEAPGAERVLKSLLALPAP